MAMQIAIAKSRKKCTQLLLMGGALWYLYVRRQHRSTRSLWARDWLRRRDELGAFDTLMSELRQEDQGSFLNFLRMSPGLFEQLVFKVTPLIQRQDTRFRKAISVGMRLAITLRYLATGDSFKSLSYLFRVANNMIGLIVPEPCTALYDVLHDDYLKCPSTEAEWKTVAHDFQEQWNFPNCIGALDGKHVSIRKPVCSGAKFFNYKHYFSIILLALVDANYRFLWCDIGAQGRCSDSGVFTDSDLKTALNRKTVGFPSPALLPGTNEEFPFCIVADDAFPLTSNLMKPYPHRNLEKRQRLFNYRLSRARRCVENAFGIMSNRFRVMLQPICLEPNKVDEVILACCVLHNWLRTVIPNNYVCHHEQEDGNQFTAQVPQAKVSGRRSVTQKGKDLRDKLSQYFVSPHGRVSWQDSMI